MKKPFRIKMRVLAFSTLALLAGNIFTSCRQEIAEESRFTFTGELIADHLKKDTAYSYFCEILDQAKIGKKAGSMLTTLSTYGSYTCFAPTNDAIRKYLQEKYQEYQASVDSNKIDPGYKIVNTGITSPYLDELSDSMATVIAKNHILEEGWTTIEVGNGAFPKKTMNRRSVMLGWRTDENGYSIATADGVDIIEQNIETENGYIHCIAGALTPSDMATSTLLASQSEFSLFSEALAKTGLDEYLTLYDVNPDYDGLGLEGYPFKMGQNTIVPPYPEKNNQGFTLLVETNDLFADPTKNSFGMSIQSLDDLVEFAEKWYKYDEEIGEEELKELKKDYTNPDNALYKFVAYHIIDRKLLYKSSKGPGGFIMEGYQTIGSDGEISQNQFDSEENMPRNFDRYDYFETALPFTSIKVTKPFTNPGELRNQLVVNYTQEMGTKFVNEAMAHHTNIVIEETSVTKARPGLSKFQEQAVNGMIYTIDKILIYNENEMAGNVLNERMRWDIFSLFPELTNNDIRWTPQIDGEPLIYIPDNYCSRMRYNSTDTHVYYLKPNDAGLGGYVNYQGDEMLVIGKSDFQYRIPYVPAGTYEIRFGFSMSNMRGIIQFYFGEDGKLQICGIPLDMNTRNMQFLGWEEESENEDENRKYDKAMRNRGFMKAPASIFGSGSDGVNNFRHSNYAYRRIVGTYQLEKGKNYWLRFKDVTDGKNDNGQNEFNQDYLEIVPTGIITNPGKPEDIY